MSWEAVGAIGEVFGAVATLTMLIYLSIQVKHAREATQSASELQSATLLTQLTQSVSQDRHLIQVWDQVLQGKDDLDATDTLQYLWTISSFGQAAEGVFLQYQKGMVSESLWQNWERGFTLHIGTKIGLAWWSSKASPYSDAFYNHMTSIIESKQSPYAKSSKDFLSDETKE